MIREAREFVDNDGRKVTGYFAVEIEDDSDDSKNIIKLSLEDDATIYSGTIGIRTSMGVMPVEFIFPKDYELADCFLNFEEHASQMIEQMKKDAEDKILIMTPEQIRRKTIR
jgi:hypothetical protein